MAAASTTTDTPPLSPPVGAANPPWVVRVNAFSEIILPQWLAKVDEEQLAKADAVPLKYDN